MNKIATENYIKALEKASQIMGVDTTAVIENAETNLAKNREVRQNALTDIMSTTNTGFGEEAIKEVQYTDELYDMVTRLPGLLAKLPANHGQVMASRLEGDIIGEPDLFKTATEPTGSQSTGGRTTNNAVATGKTDIKIKGFNTIVAITKKDLFISKAGYQNFYNKLQNRILLGLNRTIESYIINGDIRTTGLDVEATANVNFYDVAGGGTIPADAHYLGGNNLIRATGIDFNGAGIVGGNIAFARQGFLDMMEQVSDYMDDFSKLLWIQSGKIAIKTRGLTEYKSTETSNGNVQTPSLIMFPEGIEAYVSKAMPSLVGVSGKTEVGAGAANDFVTQALVYKFAVQYAYGMDMQFVVTEDSQRIFFDVYAEFGAEVVTNKAGLGNTVSVGVFQK